METNTNKKIRKKVFDENILVNEKKSYIDEEKLNEKLSNDEDNLYVIPLLLLENYLPQLEAKFGEFNYSSDSLKHKEKYMELFNYIQNICHIEYVEDLENYSKKTFLDRVRGRNR